ncbi:hypothetical protein TNCV_4534751 [Trichonephila clavipes]|nr:hypothetical protein TNCV_4534751 [Trichonephila clavipes]
MFPCDLFPFSAFGKHLSGTRFTLDSDVLFKQLPRTGSMARELIVTKTGETNGSSNLIKNKTAEIGDEVADIALPTAVYSATSSPEPNPSAEIQELAKQIVELKLQISRMSRPRNKQFFRRKLSRNRNRAANREAICSYHKRFRENAHNCVPPCDLHHQSHDRPSSQSENGET